MVKIIAAFQSRKQYHFGSNFINGNVIPKTRLISP